ncbi:putative photosynthetic complex assembly protein PuhE [Aurantiacibacter poecillastricola]|uniref:putative photosynthetic complex assembly protein PuhE n=1 Tax=Aurantiacibacter poecillastricola TaxID=3064385 RepID=UPI00273E4742|nr:putative photosynthetic complex assembly protein PuhE [Aurantiacibacter sp. 219JJ12-13]MDP5260404.1 putative photosynthetic complex assembly protein PuhE [Aurantiacibacter sp. 219JJ12-13]
MVSWSGHVLPVAATVAIWFLATGLVAWLDNLDRRTFPRSLALGALAGLAGLVGAILSLGSATPLGAYGAFAAAILVWSWHEIGFLTGAVTGPRRTTCPPQVTAWARFATASATVIHHEITLAVTALLLISISWGAPNTLAAMTFALLYAMRLSSKLNIFHGVPNASTDILPPHLGYLKSYFGPSRLGWPLLASIAVLFALSAWLGSTAVAAPAGSAEAVSASLLFALAALGTLEHLFLALPLRDGALWGWALPRSRKTSLIRGEDN